MRRAQNGTHRPVPRSSTWNEAQRRQRAGSTPQSSQPLGQALQRPPTSAYPTAHCVQVRASRQVAQLGIASQHCGWGRDPEGGNASWITRKRGQRGGGGGGGGTSRAQHSSSIPRCVCTAPPPCLAPPTRAPAGRGDNAAVVAAPLPPLGGGGGGHLTCTAQLLHPSLRVHRASSLPCPAHARPRRPRRQRRRRRGAPPPLAHLLAQPVARHELVGAAGGALVDVAVALLACIRVGHVPATLHGAGTGGWGGPVSQWVQLRAFGGAARGAGPRRAAVGVAMALGADVTATWGSATHGPAWWWGQAGQCWGSQEHANTNTFLLNRPAWCFLSTTRLTPCAACAPPTAPPRRTRQGTSTPRRIPPLLCPAPDAPVCTCPQGTARNASCTSGRTSRRRRTARRPAAGRPVRGTVELGLA